MVSSIAYNDVLTTMFDKDKEFLNSFVNIAFEEYNNDNNVENLVVALKCVAQAKGGITLLAEKTGLSRQTIYNTFSLNGSPKLSSFMKILNVLGFEFKIVPITQEKKAV